MHTRALIMTWTLLALFLTGGCRDSNAPASPEPADSRMQVAQQQSPQSANPIELSVPRGQRAVIDGTISPSEWNAAAIEVFPDGSELLLMHAEDHLYLGVRAIKEHMIVANVFVNRGDEIAILHTSAAIGTAVYRPVTEHWERTQAFAWSCRRIDDGEAAQAERSAFLQEEHWVAANARRGTPNELEYQIEWPDQSLQIAVIFLRAANPNEKLPWPIELNDDCIKPTPGGMPALLHFEPDTWATLNKAS